MNYKGYDIDVDYVSSKYGVGEKFLCSGGELVIKGRIGDKYLIEFENTGYYTLAYSSNISKGNVKNKTLPVVCGVGYEGLGDIPNSKLKKKAYVLWSNMIKRCYGTTYDRYGNMRRTYSDVVVSDDWHSFSNFYNDIQNLHNFTNWFKDSSKYHLDKDVLYNGARVYSKHTCTFLPKEVNEYVGRFNQKVNIPPLHLINCTGSIVYVEDYWVFCEQYKIPDKSSFVKMLRGEYKQAYGWSKAHGTEVHKFTNLGEVRDVCNISTFAKELGTMSSSLWRLVRGERKQYKGWKYEGSHILTLD